MTRTTMARTILTAFLLSISIAYINGQFGICVEECSMHSDCPAGQSCQTNGCGHVCQKNPDCQPVLCFLYCENGWAKHPKTNCETCACEQVSKKMETTTMSMATDGGTTKKCTPVRCRLGCRNGWATDPKSGCEICKCKQRPSGCSPVRCMMFCKNGWATNSKGCPICSCKKPTCKPVLCKMLCANGWDRDPTTGCEICKCKGSVGK